MSYNKSTVTNTKGVLVYSVIYTLVLRSVCVSAF